MPAFHLRATLPEEGNRTLHKFSQVRDDPAVALTLLAERGPEALRYLVLPTAGLPLLSPSTLLASVPTAAVLILADDPKYLRSNRVAPALSLLWIGAVEGLATLRRGGRRRAGLALLAGAILITYLLDSRLPGGGQYHSELTRWDAVSAVMQQAVAAVPRDPSVSVVASQNGAAHLADRAYVKIWPFKYAHALQPRPRQIDWWVLDVTRPEVRESVANEKNSPLFADPPYILWLVQDAVLVATDDPPSPGRAANATFGGALHLDGYDAQRGAGGVQVRLSWHLDRPIAHDAIRHLELVGADGAVLASQDGPSTASYFGTSRWRAGQTVVEDVSVPLDAGALQAVARLRLSWLDPAAGQPLPLPGGVRMLDLELG